MAKGVESAQGAVAGATQKLCGPLLRLLRIRMLTWMFLIACLPLPVAGWRYFIIGARIVFAEMLAGQVLPEPTRLVLRADERLSEQMFVFMVAWATLLVVSLAIAYAPWRWSARLRFFLAVPERREREQLALAAATQAIAASLASGSDLATALRAGAAEGWHGTCSMRLTAWATAVADGGALLTQKSRIDKQMAPLRQLVEEGRQDTAAIMEKLKVLASTPILHPVMPRALVLAAGLLVLLAFLLTTGLLALAFTGTHVFGG